MEFIIMEPYCTHSVDIIKYMNTTIFKLVYSSIMANFISTEIYREKVIFLVGIYMFNS